MAIFIDLWPYLLTNKLCYAQLFKWGHSNVHGCNIFSSYHSKYMSQLIGLQLPLSCFNQKVTLLKIGSGLQRQHWLLYFWFRFISSLKVEVTWEYHKGKQDFFQTLWHSQNILTLVTKITNLRTYIKLIESTHLIFFGKNVLA